MLAKFAFRTYLAGVGASGLYSIYQSGNDFENEKKQKQKQNPAPYLSKFLIYNGSYATGFEIGLVFGVLWPLALVGKMISVIDKLNIITKNN